MSVLTESLLIVGTGALASLFAARFAAADLPVTMLGNWPEGVRALRDQGVHLVDTDGSESTYPVQVISSPEDHQHFSHALVLVKSWQTERTARQLVDYMQPDGRVLTLQNGLGNREILAHYFGEDHVYTGVTTSGATLLGPGRVHARGIGTISLLDHGEMRVYADWFQHAGFSVKTFSDMEGLIWGKLVVNAAINPLTALLGVPNGELLKLNTARVLMANTAREVAAVSTAKGVPLPFNEPDVEVEEVARQTAKNHSSMLQDIQRGAPTEIDAICGAIVETGTQLGVPTPINDTLYQLVKALVEKQK
jgi:2-dehydropantoate 2-reductase